MADVIADKRETIDVAKIIYILYLIGLFTGITALIGVVIAYTYKDDAPDWLQTHYEFQIRTFWFGLLYVVLGSILWIVLIGWLILAWWWVWLIVRCVKGFRYLEQRAPVPDPKTWLF